MAYTLTFEGETLGDHLVRVVPADRVNAPAVRTGLYQSHAAVRSESVNYLWAESFHVVLLRANPIALSEAVRAIQ